MARFARLAVAPLAVALTGGACFRGTVPVRELYRLAPADGAVIDPADRTAAALGAPLAGGLAVLAYDAPGLYGQPNLVYRTDTVQYGSYPSREWAVPLGVMLGDLTERVLRARPLTREPAVYDPPSRRMQSYVWRGRVREFDEVDDRDSVRAAVTLDATLARASDDSVVWTGTVRRTRAVARPTMAAIVRTLSDLASEAVATLVDDATTRARVRPATVARPPR